MLEYKDREKEAARAVSGEDVAGDPDFTLCVTRNALHAPKPPNYNKPLDYSLKEKQ